MPNYVSRQDIIDREGDTFVTTQADRDLDNSGDLDAIDDAIVDAESECDSYIAVRYTLPLGLTPATCPGALKRHCMDITVYFLAREHDVLTEETTNRYKAAIAWLEKLAKGTAMLVGIDATVAPTVGGGVTRYGPDRVMSRSKLRGAL